MIVLERGKMRLCAAPETGGGIASLTFADRDVLRAAPPGSGEVLEMACFPLVPFANRIAGGAFRFAGREIRLPPNSGGHALHGQGWRNAWRIVEHARDRATLAFDHEAGDWPWAYAAEQGFALAEDGVHIRLCVRNDGAWAMPIGLGFHPYFPRTPATTLDASVEGAWLNDATGIPAAYRAGSPFPAGGLEIGKIADADNCHARWRGQASVDIPEHGLVLTLTASGTLGFLHLYAPPDASYFCAEPVSAMPDAVNRAESPEITGLRVLRPGEAIAASMSLHVRQR
jgi:aldose 1-epimerase